MPAQNEAPKSGLASLFGGFVPKPKAPVDEPAAGSQQAGGRIKSKRRNLATRSRLGNKQVTLAATKKILDEDADIDMADAGSSAKNKKRKPRHNPYGRVKKANAAQVPKQHPVHVLIQGCPAGSEMGMVQFLQSKSKRAWTPLGCQPVSADMLQLTVDGDLTAAAIVRLDGYLFGTSTLTIRLQPADGSAQAITTDQDEQKSKLTTMDVLRLFLKSRWAGDAGYLNLDNMADDAILKKHAIRPPGDKAASAVVGPAMMKLAGEMFGDKVVSLSLANNRLLNVQAVSTLAQYLPQLQNLSLQHNLIKAYEGLEAISGTGKLLHLRELVLDGNPLVTNELKQRGHTRAYVRNIVKRFPTLFLLDGAPIQLSEDDVQQIHKTGKVLPLDTHPSYFDTQDTRSIAMDFLINYYQCYDSADRAPLALLYHPEATLSMASRLRLRADARVKRKEKKKIMDDGKMQWATINHNLKLNNPKKTSLGLLLGADAIRDLLIRLPSTIHDFSNTNDYVLDAYQTPAGMIVTLHGEFKEDAASAPYSYDRTFVLQPTQPGSTAANAGSPVTIVSDSLTVRDYVGNHGFQIQKKQNYTSIFMPPQAEHVAV
ncbi:hypothetical protein BC940DRAFT_300360 [Gongronella butleri]|nr:hypothetical protein BC940DRAFT_300360 [Gongronella butleri]